MAKNIHAQMNIKEFTKNLQLAKEKYKNECSNIVRDATVTFLNEVIKQTPPNAGKLIPKWRLYNPAVDLIAAARGSSRIWICGVKDQSTPYHLTSNDGIQMHKGMRFKVIITKRSKLTSDKFVYCKTKAQAKKVAYITTRGLMRSSWGTDIQSIGINRVHIPNLLKVLAFNPELTRYNYNRIYEVVNNQIVQVNIQNLDNQINEGFMGKAMTRANIKADKEMRQKINKLVQKNIQV